MPTPPWYMVMLPLHHPLPLLLPQVIHRLQLPLLWLNPLPISNPNMVSSNPNMVSSRPQLVTHTKLSHNLNNKCNHLLQFSSSNNNQVLCRTTKPLLSHRCKRSTTNRSSSRNRCTSNLIHNPRVTNTVSHNLKPNSITNKFLQDHNTPISNCHNNHNMHNNINHMVMLAVLGCISSLEALVMVTCLHNPLLLRNLLR